jgi:hypothetical protein
MTTTKRTGARRQQPNIKPAKRQAAKRQQRFTRRTVPGVALLTGRQIAAETGMGLLSIYAQMDDGSLPFKQVGSRRYVSRPVLEQWLRDFGKTAAA